MKLDYKDNFLYLLKYKSTIDVILKNGKEFTFVDGLNYFMRVHFSNKMYNVFDLLDTREKNEDFRYFENASFLFVDNFNLYDAPIFDTHFDIVKTYDEVLASTITKSRINNPDYSRYSGSRSEYLYGNFIENRYVNNNKYGTGIYTNINNDRSIKYGAFDYIEIDNDVKSYVSTNLSIFIVLNLYDLNLFKKINITNSTNLDVLKINNQYKERYADVLISIPDSFIIPKSVNTIEFYNIKFKNLDRYVNIENIELNDCEITNLSFKNFKNLDNIKLYNIKFKKYDNKYFVHTYIDSYKNEHTIQIFEVTENLFICNKATRALSREETQLMCASFMFTEAMKIFGFDMNQEYKFINVSFDEIKECKFNFIFDSDENNIKLNLNKNHLLIANKISFDFLHNYSINIYLNIETNELSSDGIHDYYYDKKTLDDDLLSKIIQTCDDPKFDKNFLSEFLKKKQLKNSDFLGEIPIEDFNFSFCDDYVSQNEKVYEICGFVYDKDKGWYILSNMELIDHGCRTTSNGKGGLAYHPYTINYVGVNKTLADFALFKFKFSNNYPHNYTILNNKSEKYFDILEKENITCDNMIKIEHGSLPLQSIDESILYKIDLSDKKFKNMGFYVYDEHIYRDKRPDDYSYSNGSMINYISLDIAEKLANKYKFKLDTNYILEYDKNIIYNKICAHIIRYNYKSLFELFLIISSKDTYNDFLFTLNKDLGAFKNISKANVNTNKFNTSFIKIGNNVYLLTNLNSTNYLYEINKSDDNKLDMNNLYNSYNKSDVITKIGDKLKLNNNTFSYLNLNIPNSLLTKIDTLIENNLELFGYLSKYFIIHYNLRSLNYIMFLFLEHIERISKIFIENKPDDLENINLIIDEIKNIKKDLEKPILNLLDKNIETKSISEIFYNI